MTPSDLTPIDDELLAALLAEEAALAEGLEGVDESRDGLRECLQLLRTLGPDADAGGWSDAAGGAIRFGRFTIEGELGRGGFGIVYRANDPLLGRSVALKVPRPELIASAEVRRRFLREARAAGGLDHPNIVPVLDAGPLGPVCFIASAYCPGPTLTQWLKQRTEPVPPRLAARMVADLASAVHHAHGRGVLHRDIKPSNVILSPGRADSTDIMDQEDFTPRLTDFGLAKMMDEAGDETRPMTVVGSPPYMAPEQAAGRHAEVGPSTDVHALGSILYEVLVGRPPFLGETRSETLRLVIDAEPVAPRTLRPRLTRELEIITLACLEKSPARRYGSADALREDLERHLAGLPIKARPLSFPRRTYARVRRHPTLSASGAILFLAVVGLFALLAWSNGRQRDSIVRLEREKSRADANSDEADRQRSLAARRLRGARMMLAGRALDDGKFELAQDILHDVETVEPDWAETSFAGRLLRDRADRDVLPMYGHLRDVEGLTLTRDGRALFSGDGQGVIKLWDLNGGGPIATLKGHTLPVKQFAFTADGRHMVSAASAFGIAQSEVFLWDLGTRRLVAKVEGLSDWSLGEVGIEPGDIVLWFRLFSGSNHYSDVVRFDFGSNPGQLRPMPGRRSTHQTHLLPDGREIDVVADESATTDRWVIRDGPRGWVDWITPGNPTILQPFATTNDSKTIAVAIPGIGVVCRDSTSGAGLGRIETEGAIFSLMFSPDGRTLAAGSDVGTVVLWNISERRTVELRVGESPRPRPIHVFAFSPDGSRIAVSEWAVPGGATPVTVWEVATGRKLAEYPGRRDRIANLKFAPEGRSLFIASGPTLRRWRFEREPDRASPSGHKGEAWAVAFSPDGELLASGADDERETKTIKLWDPASGKLIRDWHAGRGTVTSLSFSADGSWLASGHLARSENVRIWDVKTGKLNATLIGHTDRVRSVVFQPGGSLLASAGSDPTIRIWDVANIRFVRELKGHTLTVQGLAFSPSGTRLASAGADGAVRVWDVDSGNCVAALDGADKFTSVAFSSDGSTLAAADEDGEVTLWNAATLERRIVLRGESGVLRTLVFSPDGHELIAAGERGVIEAWEPRIGQRVLAFQASSEMIHSLAFSRDGRSLAVGDHAGGVRLLKDR